MSAGVYLLLLLLSFMVQPFLLVKEKLAAAAALYHVMLVRIAGVHDELVIILEFFMAIFAFVFLAKETHLVFRV